MDSETIYRSLPCELTPEEIAHSAMTCAELIRQYDQAEEEKKTAAAAASDNW